MSVGVKVPTILSLEVLRIKLMEKLFMQYLHGYFVTLWKFWPPLAPFGLVGYGILLGTLPHVWRHNHAV